MFGNINLGDEKDLVEVNRVGGGNFVKDTGAVTIIIEKAYVDTAKSGALQFVFEGKTEDGMVLKHNDYIVSGETKGCKPIVSTFPKYNSLAKLITGGDLIKLTPIRAEVMCYDFDLKKETPQQKEVIKEFIGKPIEVLLTKKREFKQAQNAAGVYENTTETRDSLELNCFLDPVSHKTYAEKAGGEAAEFKSKWLEKNTPDYFIDKTGGAKSVKPGATSGSTGTAATKTFGINQG